MPEKLDQDMGDLLRLFNASRVQYLVIGAHALGVYAEPRATKDLDIWVNPTPENARRVFDALKQFGAPLQGASVEFFTDPDTFLVIGVAPNRIDILKSIRGSSSRSAGEREKLSTSATSKPISRAQSISSPPNSRPGVGSGYTGKTYPAASTSSSSSIRPASPTAGDTGIGIPDALTRAP